MRTWLRHPPGGKPLAPKPKWISNSGVAIVREKVEEVRLDDPKESNRPGG